MNKIIFFCILNILISKAYSLPLKGNFKVSLSYTTNLKFQKKYILERMGQKIFLNGLLLPSEKIFQTRDLINFLLFSDSTPSTKIKCESGSYTFQIDKQGPKKIEHGCLVSNRFANLFNAFRSI